MKDLVINQQIRPVVDVGQAGDTQVLEVGTFSDVGRVPIPRPARPNLVGGARVRHGSCLLYLHVSICTFVLVKQAN